jgi:leader peptidase (prepilin peptidase) / N-methyltransferase
MNRRGAAGGKPAGANFRLQHEWTIGAAAVIGVAVSIASAPGLRGALGACLALLMLAIAVVDARRFVIPNEFTAIAFVLGLFHAVATRGELTILEAGAMGLLRAGVLALLFLALREAYRRLRGREGIGLGDVKLAAVAGAWLDWAAMPLAVEIAALAALMLYAAAHLAGGRPLRASRRIPFGLFLAPAIWLAWLIEPMLFAY